MSKTLDFDKKRGFSAESAWVILEVIFSLDQ